MPIVLAIEPDRRQAAHLTAIMRHHVDAELVLADTTEGALDAIGNRVPDLVLVPALLSPQDDAALAAALRVIAAATHVRTLTIPVLANGVARAEPGGILAKWRRARAAAPEPDGCEPAVFGEQISAYLGEAAAERAQLEDDLQESSPVPETRPQPEPVLRPLTPTFDSDSGLRPLTPTFDSDPGLRPLTPTFDSDPEAQPWAADPVEERVVDLSDELADLSDQEEDDAELFDGERVGVYTISGDDEMPAIDAFDLLPQILDAPAAAVDSTSSEPTPADIDSWVPMYLTPGRLWPALEGMPAEAPAARTEQPDWIELVASLRQDLERRRTDPSPAVDPLAARPSDGSHAEPHRLVKKPRAQPVRGKPVQDEWGFFDPEQCGFSTLLAKLEEITDEEAAG